MADPFGRLANQRKGDFGIYDPATGWRVLHPGTTKQVIAYGSDSLPAPVSLDNSYITAAFAAYTPTITAAAGAITSVSATGRYVQVGKLLFLQSTITVTTNGTGATAIILPLPGGFTSAAFAYVINGRANAVSGKQLHGAIQPSTTSFSVFNYDGSYPAADGEVLQLSGFIEVV